MGGYLSRPHAESTTQEAAPMPTKRPLPIDTEVSDRTAKKHRPAESDVEVTVTNDATANSKPASTPKPEQPIQSNSGPIYDETIDPTPDGKIYRLSVSSPALYWSSKKDVLKQLNKLSLPHYTGLNKFSKRDLFYLTFPNAQCAEQGEKLLSSHVFKKQPWEVARCQFLSSRDQQRTRVQSGSSDGDKIELPTKSAADVTAPYRNMKYSEQIEQKTSKIDNALCLVTKNIRKELRHISSLRWLSKLLKRNKEEQKPNSKYTANPACCPLIPIIQAEDQEGLRHHYRNKNEFSVGYLSPSHEANNDISIGYSIGSMRNGQFFVAPANDDCKTTSRIAIDIAQALTQVFNESKLKAYNPLKHTGYWRQVLVKEALLSNNKQVIVVISVGLSNNAIPDENLSAEQKLYKEKDPQCRYAVIAALHSLFKRRKMNVEKLGIFWQPTTGANILIDTPIEHLHGIKDMTERLRVTHSVPSSNSGDAPEDKVEALNFRIQPMSFFQVNKLMTEKLYSLIAKIANVDKDTVVLDLCCGTGTIGLSLASFAHSVVGIEIVEAAVRDARSNAKLNGINNATFLVGAAEKCIQEAIKLVAPGKRCVVILDPPRAGVANSVMTSVRAMPCVDEIVYVACEPDNFWKNALPLCRPRSKVFKLEPFRPKVAYGIDLFPHTKHLEMMVLLERTEWGDGRSNEEEEHGPTKDATGTAEDVEVVEVEEDEGQTGNVSKNYRKP